jgi:hypothetical protein
MEVTLTYGRESITKNLPEDSALSALATRTNLQALGAPTDNAKFTLDGDEISSHTVLTDGAEVFVEQKAHQKA